MTTSSITKEELRVWKLVQTRINEDLQQHDVSGQQDDDLTAQAAASQEHTDSRQRMAELLEAKPGTFVFTFRAPTDDEPDEPTCRRISAQTGEVTP